MNHNFAFVHPATSMNTNRQSPTIPVYVPPTESETLCSNCDGNDFAEGCTCDTTQHLSHHFKQEELLTYFADYHSADIICTGCGVVRMERTIDPEAEWRIFSDDSSSLSKIRTGQAYNPLMAYSLTQKSRLERDDKEFLFEGMKNTEELFFKLCKGDCLNVPVMNRAKELFQKGFQNQVLQKQGAIPMKRGGKLQQRQKFSKRKQLVIACALRALKEYRILTWSVKDLSDLLEGIQVSNQSANNCLKEIGVI